MISIAIVGGINEFTKNPVTQASSMKRYGNLVDCATRSTACVFNQFEEETILSRYDGLQGCCNSNGLGQWWQC